MINLLGADYESRTPLMARPDLGADGTLRPVVDLLVEQIECALKPEVTLNPYMRLMLGHKGIWHGVCSVLDE